MNEIFTSDVSNTYTRSLEVFFPNQQLCIKAVIDRVEGDNKYLEVKLSGLNSKDGKVFKGIHAARFLKYIAEQHNNHELTRLCQCYCMIFKGEYRLQFDLATVTIWPLL